jgi:hypothetical protein
LLQRSASQEEDQRGYVDFANSPENQHQNVLKSAKHWFGLYVEPKVNHHATHSLRTMLERSKSLQGMKNRIIRANPSIVVNHKRSQQGNLMSVSTL